MNRTLLSLSALFLIGIAGLHVLRASQVDQGRPVPITPMGRTISGQRVPFMTGSGIWDQLRLVVRDRDLWVEVWKRIYSIDPDHLNPNGGQLPPLPEIDFSREMVIVVGMGRRPSSAYGIFIDSAYERNYGLEVVVRSVENRKGCGAMTVMTAPVDIVRLPRTDRPVLFRETEVVPDCR
jgi:hypothetical protein